MNPYTNRESPKGRDLAHDPRAAITFNWPARQVRIEGVTELTPDDVSDAYFASRPLEARDRTHGADDTGTEVARPLT